MILEAAELVTQLEADPSLLNAVVDKDGAASPH